MEHAIVVTAVTDTDTIQLRCSCGEQVAGRHIEVLQTWAESHLRSVEPVESPPAALCRQIGGIASALGSRGEPTPPRD
jgi:hypothetical protein